MKLPMMLLCKHFYPRRPSFVGLGRQCHRSPASLLTVICCQVIVTQ